MSIYNSKRDILSPFSTCQNFYPENNKMKPKNDFIVKKIKKKPSQKLALKCQKIELEDNIEKQRLYESKINSLDQKLERFNESKKRSSILFKKRQLNTSNQINSLKTELKINEKLILEKENNILTIKESINKQENFLHNISKINNLDKEKLLKKKIIEHKKLIKDISETNFERQNNLNRFKEDSENLNIDIKNISSQIKSEKDYKNDIQEKINIFKTSLNGQIDINKMNSKQYEELKKIYEEKNNEFRDIVAQIKYYKEKLLQKINKLSNFEDDILQNIKTDKINLLNIKNSKENEITLKKNLEKIKINVYEKDKKILDLKQKLMEKEFIQKENNEEISYSENFLDSLKNVVKKNIDTYYKFSQINKDIKIFTNDLISSDLNINRVKNDIDNIKKLI